MALVSVLVNLCGPVRIVLGIAVGSGVLGVLVLR